MENVAAHLPSEGMHCHKTRTVPELFPCSGVENVPDVVHLEGEAVNVTAKLSVKSTTTPHYCQIA
jgi:hypothetical protein